MYKYGEKLTDTCDICGSTNGVFDLVVGPYQRTVCTGCRLAIMGPVELVYLNALDRLVYRMERDKAINALEAATDNYEFEARRNQKLLADMDRLADRVTEIAEKPMKAVHHEIAKDSPLPEPRVSTMGASQWEMGVDLGKEA